MRTEDAKEVEEGRGEGGMREMRRMLRKIKMRKMRVLAS